MRIRSLVPALAALLLLAVPPAHARRIRGDKPPKALLVELLTHSTQIDYIRRNRPEQLAEIRRDVHEVMMATVRDFSRNFEYCPVYFFIDTNADRIRDHHFDGVLLDKDLQPVQQQTLQDGDTSFFIAVYGGHVSQPQRMSGEYRPNDDLGPLSESYGDDPTSLKITLLVMDHRFELLRQPRPRTVKNYVSRSRRNNPDLYYRSRRFELDYTPLAASYDATIEKYYRERRKRYYGD